MRIPMKLDGLERFKVDVYFVLGRGHNVIREDCSAEDLFQFAVMVEVENPQRVAVRVAQDARVVRKARSIPYNTCRIW
jgi:hypothetical protein